MISRRGLLKSGGVTVLAGVVGVVGAGARSKGRRKVSMTLHAGQPPCPDIYGCGVGVSFDGIFQKWCTALNESGGWLERLVPNPKSPEHVLTEWHNGGYRAVTERVHGDVALIWNEGHGPGSNCPKCGRLT